MLEDTLHLSTLEPREEPPAKAIIREMREAMIAATSMNIFERLKRCHETTKCIWSGQRKDGRLGKPSTFDKEKSLLFRWPGAPDVSVPLADTIIRWLVMIRTAVFNRGDARLSPERLPDDNAARDAATGLAGLWQTVVEFFLNKQDWMFSKAYGLFSTCVEEFGYAIMMVDWQKKRRNELRKMTLQSLSDALSKGIMQQAQADNIQVTPEQLTQKVQFDIHWIIGSTGAIPDEQIQTIIMADPLISEKEARVVIRALRKDPGAEAEYIVPQDDGGVPIAEAYIPYINCLHPHDMTGDGQTDWFAVPKYFSRSALEERSKAEGWDEKLTQEMIETQPNKFFYEWFGNLGLTVPDWALNGMGIALSPDRAAMKHTPRWMVFYIWRKITNEDGLPMVYHGVVHPFMEQGMLLWEPTNQREISVLVDTSEDVPYAILSRGVPDIVVDKQNFIKDSTDAEGARGQLGSNPPFVRAQGVHIGVRPGLELDGGRGRVNFVDSKFLDVPVVDQGTFALMDRVEKMVRDYYFCHKDTMPDDKRLFMESLSFRSLRCMTKLIKLIWQQVQENIDELHVSNIAGRAVKLDVSSRDQLAGEADVHVGFHLDGLNKEASEKFFDMLAKLMQADRAGRVDWGEATQIAVQLFAPTYARRLVVPAEQATQQIVADQDNRIAKIVAGVPMSYDEHVSAPESRLQRMQQWLQNPENMALAQSSQTRQDLVQKEMDSLQFALEQQTSNPVAGRTGVKPN